jgi:hypothetical protein
MSISGPEQQSGQAVPGTDPAASGLAADEAAASDASASVANDLIAAGDTSLSADAVQVETDEATLAAATTPVVAQQDD